MSQFGRYVIRARERRGWDRAELARVSSVPYTTLRNIERSKRNVRAGEETIKALADALGETERERDDYFQEMRILSGYMINHSSDASERDRRLIANLAAYPELRASLEKIFARGDTEDIDRLFTVLEYDQYARQRRPKEPR